jgi:hypothetical protein
MGAMAAQAGKDPTFVQKNLEGLKTKFGRPLALGRCANSLSGSVSQLLAAKAAGRFEFLSRGLQILGPCRTPP